RRGSGRRPWPRRATAASPACGRVPRGVGVSRPQPDGNRLRLARPGAPVASRGHEVAVRGAGLLPRRRPVTVDGALRAPHLEEPEVLAVLGTDEETGLAACDRDRLVPEARAERLTNRFGRRGGVDARAAEPMLASGECAERRLERAGRREELGAVKPEVPGRR